MGEKKKLVLDTNIIMESIDVLKGLKDEYDCVIPLIVLEELDNIKDSRSDIRKHKARIGIKFLNTHYDEFIFDNKECEGKPDNQIIQVAENYGCKIASNDICVGVKGKSKGIEVLSFIGNQQDYKGYRYFEVDTNNDEDNEMLARIYQYPDENILDLYINEYLIIKDKNKPLLNSEYICSMEYETMDILRWDGERYVKLKYPPQRVIKPLNDLQACALDLLGNKDVTIKVIAGNFGSGKSYLATTMGVHMVEDKGHYSKLLMVRNTDTKESGEIGFLPGTVEDKTDLFFKSMFQYLPQGEYQAEKMRNEGRLECHIPYYMRGLSLSGFMIFDEAQQSRLSDIKKIGTRIEGDSCICLTGDWKQAEGVYKSDSGLIQLIDQTKDNPLVGVVVLDEDIRSKTSKVFADLV